MKKKISPVEHYIIDGYNVMHSFPKYKTMMNSNLEEARLSFIQHLNNYFYNKRPDITVVFDGEKNISELNALSTPKIKVVFSPLPEKADLKIKKMIDLAKNKSLLIVVSSDREVFQYAKVSRCTALSSTKFCAKLSSKTIDIENGIKNRTLSQEEIILWKDIFNNKTSTN